MTTANFQQHKFSVIFYGFKSCASLYKVRPCFLKILELSDVKENSKSFVLWLIFTLNVVYQHVREESKKYHKILENYLPVSCDIIRTFN